MIKKGMETSEKGNSNGMKPVKMALGILCPFRYGREGKETTNDRKMDRLVFHFRCFLVNFLIFDWPLRILLQDQTDTGILNSNSAS